MDHESISEQGLKDYMEDTYYVSRNLNGGMFAGIYDGHKGKEASEYAQKNIHKFFAEKTEKDPEEMFKFSYKKTSDALSDVMSGTTAVNVYVKDGFVFWANTGDSNALVIKNNGHAIQLTEDHRLDNHNEMNRIKNAGGVLVNGYAMKGAYGIQPTRALGDTYFKSMGILSEPATGKYKLEENDSHIIVGSDGLFDFMENEEIGKFITSFSSIKKAAEELKKEILENRKGNDNLTFILISIFEQKNSLGCPGRG